MIHRLFGSRAALSSCSSPPLAPPAAARTLSRDCLGARPLPVCQWAQTAGPPRLTGGRQGAAVVLLGSSWRLEWSGVEAADLLSQLPLLQAHRRSLSAAAAHCVEAQFPACGPPLSFIIIIIIIITIIISGAAEAQSDFLAGTARAQCGRACVPARAESEPR